MNIETHGEQQIFEIQVHLDDLDPETVRVELYADGTGDGAPVRQEMRRVLPGDTYRAQVAATRAAEHYTVRVIPHHDGVAVPLEAAQLLWHR
jgi:starch phosphorylase